MRIKLIALHLIPGIVFTVILFSVTPLILQSNIDVFLFQICLVSIFLLGLEILIAQYYCKKYEGRSLWKALSVANSIELNWKKFGYAILWGVLTLLFMKIYFRIGDSYIQTFQKLSFLQLPSWHFQSIGLPPYPQPFLALLVIFMVASNMFAEEIYFRGFLLERLGFLGRWAFIINGSLFIFYHFFQVGIAYPSLPFGILVSAYYAKFRNVWGTMLIHLVFNMGMWLL